MARKQSRSNPGKNEQTKRARRAAPESGELGDAALDKVAGGGGVSVAVGDVTGELSSVPKREHEIYMNVVKNMKA